MTTVPRFLPLPLLLIASEAVAAPCEVTIARAPDDVREAIETWVRAEPRCASSLEVRVVPTEGGYYLLARDPSGRVHERVVPDAQSAGVLVASWVADDVPAAPPVAPAPVTPAPETIIEIAPPATVTIEAPGAQLPGAQRPVADVRERLPAVAARGPARWLSVGGLVRMEGGGGGGARAELDLVTRGPWSAGLAVAMSRSYLTEDGINNAFGWSFETLETQDLRAAATAAYTSRRGAWELRLAGGLGAVRTRAVGSSYGENLDTTTSGEGVTGFAEASIQLSRRLGRSWAIGAGPLATLYQQRLGGTLVDNQTFETMTTTVNRIGAELSMFAGLRYAL